MLWDIDLTEQAIPRAVTGIDLAHWDRVTAYLAAPVIVPPCYTTAPREAEAVEQNGGYAANAQRWREINLVDQPTRRPTAAKYRRGRGLTPCPVYVAHYADGRQLRCSFWSPEKGPIDFAQGYNVALVLGRAAPVDGYWDNAGQAVRDPFFAPAATVTKIRKDSAAVRLAAICKALNEGAIEAALHMARAA